MWQRKSAGPGLYTMNKGTGHLLIRVLGNGRIQPPDGLAQSPCQRRPAKQFPFRRRFTGREMRPVPDLPRLQDQLPDLSAVALAKEEPFDRGVFDDGFVKAHGYYKAIWQSFTSSCSNWSKSSESTRRAFTRHVMLIRRFTAVQFRRAMVLRLSL